MPTNTYIPLATITLPSNQTTVTFSNIPSTLNGATLKDLILITNGKVGGNSNMVFYFNSDTGNGTSTWSVGNGAGPGSGTIGFVFAGTWNANQESNAITQIMDFSATDKQKICLTRSNQTADQGVWEVGSRWASNTAITSITIDPTGSNTITSGSTLSLYGIAG
jgi:hypothetical protein